MTTIAPDQCLSAAELADSPLHRVVLSFKIFTCFCGLAGDVWIWKYEGTRWLAHPNARTIYMLHLFWATFVAVTYAIPMIFDLFRFLTPRADNCEYLVPVFVSFWIRFVPAYAINAQSFAMCALAIERTIASVFLKWYEKQDKAILGVVLSVVAVVLPLIQLYVLIISPNTWVGNVVSTSILTADNTNSYNIHLRIQQVMESTTMFCFVFTFVLNKFQSRRVRVSTANMNILSLRYQIKETTKVVNSLLPCFCVHFSIFFAPPIILSWRRNMLPALSAVDNYRWIEVTSEFQLYSLFMPLIIWLLRRHERRKSVVNSHKGIDKHFDHFNAWIA